jgi:hypothetical protein
MRIVVTQEDINNSSAGAKSCPIATAVKRITGHPFSVTASPVAICLHTEDGTGSEAVYWPSRKAVEFMADFDDGETIGPAVFVAKRATV